MKDSFNSLRNRSSVHSHIHRYFKDLNIEKRSYVNLDALHPECRGRSPQTCKAKYDLVTIEVCGEKLQFCTACAADLNTRVTKVMAAHPQKHYWQANDDFSSMHVKITGQEDKVASGKKSWEVGKRNRSADQDVQKYNAESTSEKIGRPGKYE